MNGQKKVWIDPLNRPRLRGMIAGDYALVSNVPPKVMKLFGFDLGTLYHLQFVSQDGKVYHTRMFRGEPLSRSP